MFYDQEKHLEPAVEQAVEQLVDELEQALEEQAAEDEQAQEAQKKQEDSQMDPFQALLNEIIAAGSAESTAHEQANALQAEIMPPPTRQQVAELAEELAEETVAEAIQNFTSEAPQSTQEVDEISDAEEVHTVAVRSSDDSADDMQDTDDDTSFGASGEVGALPQNLDAHSKLALAKRALLQARDTLTSVIDLLNDEMLESPDGSRLVNDIVRRSVHSAGARMVEGVFDGERMMSGDGRIYPVPPNYASKSKLVEGDMLKLTIMPDGKMIYKQVGPTARDRVRGILSCDERGGYCVLAAGTRYKIIPASVSFFRGRPGDHVVALVPKGSPSKFAAVDFIVHQ